MTSTLVSPTTSPPLVSRGKGIAFCIAFSLETVAIVIGNLIAIGAFSRQTLLRRRSFYLLLNLAVADLLNGGFTVGLRVYFLAKQFDLWDFYKSPKMAIAYETLSSLLEGASLMGLVMISFERMYAIVWPLKHRVLQTKVYYLFIALVWCFACIVPASHLAKYGEWISEKTNLIIWIAFQTSLLLLISINYVTIWIKCRFGATANRMDSARERRLAKSLFLTTFVSIVTLLPAPIAYHSMKSHGVPLETRRVAYMSAALLSHANSLVNPIIYTFRMPEFREYAVPKVCRRSTEERTEEINIRDL